MNLRIKRKRHIKPVMYYSRSLINVLNSTYDTKRTDEKEKSPGEICLYSIRFSILCIIVLLFAN